MVTWREEMDSLRRRLPEQVQRTLELHEANEDYQHPDYQAASRIFYGEHLCRVVPLPDEVQRTIDWIGYDPTVYGTMNGPTEFLVIGKLKDWSIEDRLHEVEVPTLVISGRHDEATPRVVGAATGTRAPADLRGVEPYAAYRGAGRLPAHCQRLPPRPRLGRCGGASHLSASAIALTFVHGPGNRLGR